MTAGIDLALAMIEQDLGADVARAIARQLVVYQPRTARFFREHAQGPKVRCRIR